MTPFLNCYILCVNEVEGKNYIKWIIPYNSLTNVINEIFTSGDIIIPEFEIYNIHYINSIDLELCEDKNIEIIRRTDKWELYLDNYEQHIGS